MGKVMTGREWGSRPFRLRAWKTTGAVLLSLLSGSLGCQGTGNKLRQHASNGSSATAAAAGYPPQTTSAPGRTAAQARPGGQSGITQAAAFAPDANKELLQIGATQVVPWRGGTNETVSVDSLVRASYSPEASNGSTAAEPLSATPPTTVPAEPLAGDAAALALKQKIESEERKWTAAPLADAQKAGGKGKAPSAKDEGYRVDRKLPSPTEGMPIPAIPCSDKVHPLTLAAALSQAGVANPTIGIALQAVQVAQAQRLLADILLVPNVNVGSNYGEHTGPIQASFGAIRKVDRQTLDYGFGTYVDAANTVKIPGLLITTPIVDAIFSPRFARYVVSNRQLAATATRNNIFLDVSTAYLDLMEAETRLAIIRQSEKDFEEIVRLTKSYAKRGRGREGDAERAEADRLMLRYSELHEQQEVAVASADLAQLLNLDPSARLVTGDIPLQVVQFVDPKVPLPKLLDLAVRNHPAILAADANVRASQVRVRQETARPLLPILWAGLSAGEFGGGANATTSGTGVYNPNTGNTNLVTNNNATGQTVPVFGKISPRVDVDVIAYWQLQNMGLGNLAIIRREKANRNAATAERLRIVNDVREDLSVAFNKSAENFRSIAIQRRRVQEATEGFQRDLIRIRGGIGLPIEVLDNAKRLREAREALLEAVIGFDRAQFQLFVALGQPPTLVVEDDKPPMDGPVEPVVPLNGPLPVNVPPPEQLPAPNALPPGKQ